MTEEQLKNELNKLSLSNISIGYIELQFAKGENLADLQIGYRVNDKGESLIGTKNGDWQQDWFVIGQDDMGDPIFISLQSEKIFTAAHGEGDWEAILIANNLNELKRIVNKLEILGRNRSNPDDLESHPFNENEIHDFETFLSNLPGDIETWFWSNFLEV